MSVTDQHSHAPTGDQVTVDRVVARQPIIGHGDRVVGFQLLQRPVTEAADAPTAEDGALSVTRLLSELSFDIDLLFGDTQLFCRPGLELLTGTTRVARPTRRTVLEVPAELGAYPEVVARCGVLWAAGYSIAAELSSWQPDIEPMLKLAEFVRIDVASMPRAQVEDLVVRCRPYDVTLLAAQCLTEEDLTWATETGFRLFQGPAVVHPVALQSESLAPSALARAQLASELLDERLDFATVEETLTHEPGLVVQVLHLASLGAQGGLRREVHSIREALVLLGTTRLRQWAALTVLSREVGSSRTDALAVALVRARMCELLADRAGIERGFAFTAGLLSALDLLVGVPIAEVEHRVDVDAELSSAAFHHGGQVGRLVRLVTAYEDAVAAGEPTPFELGDVELVAAMAFAWAMSHVRAIERTPRPR